ncbi:alpha/beta fold hydrolase [Ramlibacter algicola]|uniref:Alpha/beta hydrolase n=1 Tax=Ramlibacter algicola TaxID=2795217 RepID=A0A934USG9_9BURK|nr:alpha/beta hydrolase [Ramlibacter algicola]
MIAGRLPRKRRLPLATGAIEYVLSGRGPATLVLFNGAGVTLEGWSRLYPDIERLGRVVAWNRFGTGASTPPRGAQDGLQVVATAREVLRRLSLEPPYVLVGHSLGGLHAQLFARRHSEEVAGVVLLEATHPRDRELLHGHEPQLAKVLGKLLSIPQQLFRPNLHAELDWLDEAADEVEAAGPFPSVPLAVVSGGNDPPRWLVPPSALRIRRRHQKELALLSPLGMHAVARRSGHFPQITQPSLVVDAIRSVVHAAAPGAPRVPS